MDINLKHVYFILKSFGLERVLNGMKCIMKQISSTMVMALQENTIKKVLFNFLTNHNYNKYGGNIESNSATQNNYKHIDLLILFIISIINYMILKLN